MSDPPLIVVPNWPLNCVPGLMPADRLADASGILYSISCALAFVLSYILINGGRNALSAGLSYRFLVKCHCAHRGRGGRGRRPRLGRQAMGGYRPPALPAGRVLAAGWPAART